MSLLADLQSCFRNKGVLQRGIYFCYSITNPVHSRLHFINFIMQVCMSQLPRHSDYGMEGMQASCDQLSFPSESELEGDFEMKLFLTWSRGDHGHLVSLPSSSEKTICGLSPNVKCLSVESVVEERVANGQSIFHFRSGSCYTATSSQKEKEDYSTVPPLQNSAGGSEQHTIQNGEVVYFRYHCYSSTASLGLIFPVKLLPLHHR